MLSVMKKEWKSYFSSMTGYIFMASILFFTGLYFALFNLLSASPNFNTVLGNITFIFLLTVPILTMRLMAEESKQKTDQLLLTSPLKPSDIVLGKYFAAIGVLLMTLIITTLYPVILSTMGDVNWAEIIGGYIGFFLFGSALIALGLFISSTTDNQIVAGVVTFTVFLVIWIIDAIISSLPTSSTSGAIFVGTLILGTCLIIYSATKNLFVSIGLFIAGVAATIAAYIVNSSIFAGFIGKFFSWFSLLSRYEDFSMGILNLSPIIYYITFSIAFLFFTVRMIEKKRWS